MAIQDLASRLTDKTSGVMVECKGASLILYFVPENYQDDYHKFPLGSISEDSGDGLIFDITSYSESRVRIRSHLRVVKKLKVKGNNSVGKKIYRHYGEALGNVRSLLSCDGYQLKIIDGR